MSNGERNKASLERCLRFASSIRAGRCLKGGSVNLTNSRKLISYWRSKIMKLSAFTTAALLTATLAVDPSFSQIPIKTDLNVQLKQALCSQNWVQAIQIVDRMKAAAPQQAAELNLYRGQIQTFLRTGATIAGWPSASECAATQVTSTTPASPTPQAIAPDRPTTGASTAPTSVRNAPQRQ